MKKCKIGILGPGIIAEKMAETILTMDEAELYAVGSRSLERAQSFAHKYGVPHAYGSYEELVSDPEVELIYIATPHSHHYQHAMLCIQHHKAVLCEKAFTATAWQAQEVFLAAKQNNVLVTEAIWTRYMPMRNRINEVLASGIIGTPRTITANLCYPMHNVPRIYDPALAGGALLDLGVYTLNFAAMIFGTEVQRTFSTCELTDTGVDSNHSITLFYSDHRMAVLNSSSYVRSDRTAVISGDRGHIVIENVNNPQHMTVYDADYHVLISEPCQPQITGYEYEVRATIRALRAGELECPEMPHAESIRIMQQMDELRRAWGVHYPWDKD